MARDYKHARRSSGQGSFWSGLLVGLLLGLGVAAAVYMHDRRPGAPAAATLGAPLASEKAESDKPAPASADAETQFDFYDVLPNFEVVVPDKEGGDTAGSAGGAIDTPGSYVLQAGSYRNFADADRVRAQLALLGIESRIQKASVGVDNDTWHRVLIGPISNLNKLEETRRKLREAQIDVLVTKNTRPR